MMQLERERERERETKTEREIEREFAYKKRKISILIKEKSLQCNRNMKTLIFSSYQCQLEKENKSNSEFFYLIEI